MPSNPLATVPAAAPATHDLELTVALLDTAIARIAHRTDAGAPNLYAAVLRSLRTSRDDLAGRLDTLQWRDVDGREIA